MSKYIPIVIYALSAFTILLKVIDEYFLSDKTKDILKDKVTNIWFWFTEIDIENLFSKIYNRKTQYTFIYAGFLIIIFIFYPPISYGFADLLLWFLKISSAFLIRRFLENVILGSIFLSKTRTRYIMYLDFILHFIKEVFIRFKYAIILYFIFFVSFLIVLIVKIKIHYLLYKFTYIWDNILEYLYLVAISELITITITIGTALIIFALLLLFLMFYKLIVFILLKISDNKQSVIYSIGILFAVIATIITFFNYL